MLLKFTARQTHSCVAQWQSIRLLIGRLLVRVQPQVPLEESSPGQGEDSFFTRAQHPPQDFQSIRSGAARALLHDGPNMTCPLQSWEDAAMAYRDIRIIGDPVLRTECDWITDIDDSVKALVEDLLETVDEDGRAGLAANQIGIGLRAFSWNIDGEIGYILNPKIVEVSKDEYQDGDEGCLSVPGLWFPTERAWYARAEGVNLDGKEVVVEGEELMARCIQHECDHLEGHLYLDRLDRKNRAKAMKELRAQGL